MAISWINADGLTPLLDGGLQVALVNAAEPDSAAELLTAVVALHPSSGSPNIRRSAELSLLPGESLDLQEDRPVADEVIGVEAVLRVASPVSRTIAEIYLHSDSARTTPIENVEVGIVSMDEAPTSGSVPIPEIEGLSAYIKLEP